MINLTAPYENFLDKPSSTDYKANVYRIGITSLIMMLNVTDDYAFVMNQWTFQRISYRNLPHDPKNNTLFGIKVYIARHMSDDVISLSFCKTSKALSTVFNSWSKEAKVYMNEVESQLHEPGLFKIDGSLYVVLDMKYKGE